jgi:hypothetical protein
MHASAHARRHRSAVAGLLSNIPARADIEWDDLMAVPAWALIGDGAALTIQTLRVGAWAHVDPIRRCIDGKTLGHLAGLLGQPELNRLIHAGRLQDDTGLGLDSLSSDLGGMDADDLRRHLMHTGQWVMLLSVGRQRVRKAIAQALWPHIPHLQKDAPPPGLEGALAAAVMRAQAMPSAWAAAMHEAAAS